MTTSTLLLLPGLLCDEATWAAQVAGLSSARCIVPSYDGVDTLAEMARSVLADVPVQRFSLAGHSMGGRVALEIMRQAPGRIERIALLDTGSAPLAAGEAGERERGQRIALLHLARTSGMRTMGREWARGMVHPSRVDSPLFEEILDMVERKTPDVFEAQIHALLGRPDARQVIQSIRCPAMVLCGRQDAWSPVSLHEEMHAMMPGSRLEVVEEAGHFSMMEQPDVVTKALWEWLTSGAT